MGADLTHPSTQMVIMCVKHEEEDDEDDDDIGIDPVMGPDGQESRVVEEVGMMTSSLSTTSS